MCTILYEESMT